MVRMLTVQQLSKSIRHRIFSEYTHDFTYLIGKTIITSILKHVKVANHFSHSHELLCTIDIIIVACGILLPARLIFTCKLTRLYHRCAAVIISLLTKICRPAIKFLGLCKNFLSVINKTKEYSPRTRECLNNCQNNHSFVSEKSR